MIKLNNVNFSYAVDVYSDVQKTEKQLESIKNISLSVNKGEVVLLTGSSGCGKTTILRLINGLIPAYYHGNLKGSVLIDGRDGFGISLIERAAIMGTVFQDPRAQFFSVDTTNELAFACENQGIAEDDIYKRIDETVDRFSMQDLMDRNIFELSGGEKQKIACASIDVKNPKIILMDEPSSNLDTEAIEKLKEVISIWKSQGKTIVISEHRINYIWDITDRMYVLESGEIIKSFEAHEMKKLNNQELEKRGLRSKILEDPMNARIKAEIGHLDQDILLRELSLKRGRKQIFHIDDMKIPIGKITAIVGYNGRGKTTLLRCLAGLEKSCKGNIVFRGKIYRPKAMKNLAYLVTQDVNHQLFTESVLEEVFISDSEKNWDKDMDILKRLNLDKESDRHPMSLSGGQKQRVAVACAIASEKEILLFDEPTSGLDYTNMYELAKQFVRLCQMGKTVLIVTHDSELIRTCCEKIIYL